MRNLKNQLQELEELFELNHGQLNTEVRAAMKQKIDLLKEQIKNFNQITPALRGEHP